MYQPIARREDWGGKYWKTSCCCDRRWTWSSNLSETSGNTKGRNADLREEEAPAIAGRSRRRKSSPRKLIWERCREYYLYVLCFWRPCICSASHRPPWMNQAMAVQTAKCRRRRRWEVWSSTLYRRRENLFKPEQKPKPTCSPGSSRYGSPSQRSRGVGNFDLWDFNFVSHPCLES